MCPWSNISEGNKMANSSRLYADQSGKMFIPMNVEGGSWDEHFMTTKKLISLGLLFGGLIIMLMSLADSHATFTGYIIYLVLWLIIAQFVFRFIVFEERFYYKMYQILKKAEITTPAIFWDIASIKDTPDGAIITYSDTKIAVIVRLERDTITGKNADFQEQHYDAISDFYRDLMMYRYSFVQLNVMEPAGNDPRLDNLDKLIRQSDNSNIAYLMEQQIGYIKSITHRTLYESDYILIYTSDLTKLDSIINDTLDCVYGILEGAFIGYRILTSRELVELVKEEYGVRYFNYTQATLDMFKLSGVQTNKPFELYGITYSDGDSMELSAREINQLHSMASDVVAGTTNINEIAIKETLEKGRERNKKELTGVDIEDIEKGFTPDIPQETIYRRPKIGRAQATRKDIKPKIKKHVEETPKPAQQTFSRGFDGETDIYNDWGDFGASIEDDEDEPIDF